MRASEDRSALNLVCALLSNAATPDDLRALAASTLGSLADPGAISGLAQALRVDPSTDVRGAAAQALGKLAAVQALSDSTQQQPDAAVRLEIVHALAGQGPRARVALETLARSDPDAAVRALAASYLH